ncbi:hypothetical protein B0X71_16620 [Planococcus lenghuensis]|uniref:Calcineurin-like phosphoesterase domain-containing protein n=2 Tax=Planococcus lenghuensis TaxID=2213202 RepID=A0A1Q2L422_9BACL|nr:hypothetical protein B0X71_16620 [Planococcus lenghuensis]
MKIAVTGDLHYPELHEAIEFIRKDHREFFETFIGRFFSIPANLYVSIGDLTNIGSAEELNDVYALLRKYDKRFMHVLGNHDMYSLTRNEVLAITEQDRSYVISTEQAVLAFIDTAREKDFKDWGGTLDVQQLSWLETVIEQSGERPLILFAHHPPNGTTARSEKDKRCIHPDIPIWDVLSKKKGIGLYVNGHNHCNSIVQKGQWTFLQLAAVLDEQAVRTIEVTDSEIIIDFVDVSDPLLKAKAQIIGNSIPYFLLNRNFAGTERDVRHVIPLVPTAVAE